MISIFTKSEERRKNDEGMIMAIEKEEVNRKKRKERKIRRQNLTELAVYSLGKIVPKQISWRLVAVLSKVSLKCDLFEFTNFTF